MIDGLSHHELIVACKNIGFDLTCGSCAERFYTGSSMHAHDSRCASSVQDVVSGVHRFRVTPELYSLALAWATGVTDISQPGATVCVREQGGANIPCVIVEWHTDMGIALPVGNLLQHLGLSLPRRG
jgi:hypothetical protein